MNFLVVVIDTLRYDHIRAHGNEWIKTPNLDRLIAQSWDFSRSYCASYPTIPHRTDAITGRYGSPLFPWRPLRWDLPTLPWTLAEAGYATQLIHDTPHLVNGGHNFDWPFNAWTQVRGAEVDRPWIDTRLQWPGNWTRDPLFDFVDGEPQDMRLIPTYVRANRLRAGHETWNCARLFRTAAAWLHDNLAQERFLLWVDCFDPHEPWDVPPQFATLYDDDTAWDGRIDPRAFMVRDTAGAPEEAIRRVAALYSAKVTWVDRWLGELLDALEATGRADDTCVLLTSDHGTSLNERGFFGKRAPIHEQEGHTPFIVRLPGGERGESDIIVQPQNIFGTIAHLAGVGLPEGAHGLSVLEQAHSGSGEREIALGGTAAGPWWGNSAGQPLLTVFDDTWQMHLCADPGSCRLMRLGDTADVAEANPRVVERLWRAALAELQRRGIDERLLAWLESQGEGELGEDIVYWDGYPGPAGYSAYFSRLWEEW
ncbi:MAG: sulfatase [Armatimonadota bacterium]